MLANQEFFFLQYYYLYMFQTVIRCGYSSIVVVTSQPNPELVVLMILRRVDLTNYSIIILCYNFLLGEGWTNIQHVIPRQSHNIVWMIGNIYHQEFYTLYISMRAIYNVIYLYISITSLIVTFNCTHHHLHLYGCYWSSRVQFTEESIFEQ